MTILEWDTAAEWDAAVSESGVVHEAVTNTDHSEADAVKQGYSAASPTPATGILRYYPFHEDTGTTAYDFSGGGFNGTISGCTLGATAPLGTTAYSFDGVDDAVSMGGTIAQFTAYTIMGWMVSPDYSTGTGTYMTLIYPNANNDLHPGVWADGSADAGKVRYFHKDGSTNHMFYSSALTNGAWHHWAQTWDGSTMSGYLDGTLVNSTAISGMGDRNHNDDIGMDTSRTNWPWLGRLWDNRVYNRALSGAEISEYVDTVKATSSLHTAEKLS